jgi:hypothetical protein
VALSSGLMTLQAHWDGMAAVTRVELLRRLLAHASFLDDRLKGLTQGQLGFAASGPLADDK